MEIILEQVGGGEFHVPACVQRISRLPNILYPCSHENLTMSPNCLPTPIINVFCGESIVGHQTPLKIGFIIISFLMCCSLTLAFGNIRRPLAIFLTGNILRANQLKSIVARENCHCVNKIGIIPFNIALGIMDTSMCELCNIFTCDRLAGDNFLAPLARL